MNPFELEYWNLTTVIVWIYLRDKNFIKNEWPSLQQDKFMRSMSKAIDKKVEKDGYDTITDAYGKTYKTEPCHEKSIKELLERLVTKKKRLSVFGLKMNMESHQEIKPIEWQSLRLDLYRYLENPMAISMNPSQSGHSWERLIFPVAQVIKFWPEKPITNSALSKEKFSYTQAENAYKDWVHDCTKIDKKPSIKEDINEMRERLSNNIPRDTLRELRDKLAPDDWKRAGPRKKSSHLI